MRTFIRSVIAVVAGFLLMWPLGYAYAALELANIPLLGIDAWHLRRGLAVPVDPGVLALGYLPLFRRIDDTPLLIAGLVWGLLLASGFNIRNALGFEIAYGLLGATTVIVASTVPLCQTPAPSGAARDIAGCFPELGFPAGAYGA